MWLLPCVLAYICLYTWILRPLAFDGPVMFFAEPMEQGETPGLCRQLAYGARAAPEARRSLWKQAPELMTTWFGKKVSRVIDKIFEGMIIGVWGLLLSGLWRLWYFVTSGDRPLFKMRMNISLNVRQQSKDESGRKCYTFHTRTVEECACSEFLPGNEMNEILETAMDHAISEQNHRAPTLETEEEVPQELEKKLKGRFITVQRDTAKQINDQIVNRLSRLFGTNYIGWDMGQAVEEMEYIYAMTYEDEKDPPLPAKPLVKKFRVLLMEKGRFVEMTSNRTDDKEMPTPGSGRMIQKLGRGMSATVRSLGYVDDSLLSRLAPPRFAPPQLIFGQMSCGAGHASA